MLSYEPLWKTMSKRGETTYTLIHKYNINTRTVHRLRHNQSITLYTMERLCKILDCTPNDIVEFLPDQE